MQLKIMAMLYNFNNKEGKVNMRDLNQEDIELLDNIASLRHCVVHMPPNGKNVKYPFFIKKN